MECELQAEEQELGHYQLRRLLGEGGFGQVYEAWDSKLQRSIAIKRLKPQLLSSRPDNLLDEARLAASLRHPAFVKIFSIDGDAEQQSIIMEYVDGHTLRQLLKGNPLPEAQVLDIVSQIAEAMDEAHTAKLIHGDIKPANLMLEASGAVRIMDFGLARKIDPDATEAVAVDETQGTIAYLAPELLTGAAPNEQSDVYALGVVMYELLMGTRPFAHLNGLALAAAHLQSSSDLWPFGPDVSAPAVAMTRAMTARGPGERVASMRLCRERALGLLGKPVLAAAQPPRSLKNRLGPLAARLRWRPLALALLVLVALGGIGQFVGSASWVRKFSPLYSESAAMQEGMAALRSADRDDSIEIAIDRFTAVLERAPRHAGAAAYLSRAYALRHLGNSSDPSWLQRADASAQLALKLNDQLALAHAAQGAVRLSQGNFSQALGYADHALRLDPQDAFALILKSSILLRQRRYDEAERVIQAGLALHPRDRTFADALGTLRFAQGNIDAAAAAFRQSIGIEPDAVFAYANLSAMLRRQDRGDEALRVLQQGLLIRPSWRLYQNLGSVLFDRGEYVESAKAFERAVSGNGAADYVNWANLGDTLRWIPGRTDESRQAYRQAVERLKPLLAKAPADARLNSRMGLYLARLGEKNTAINLSERAIAIEPSSADVRFRAAMSYELVGDRENALAELRNAQSRNYPVNLISSEPDLIALRRDPRYHQPLPESSK